ncbi:MAG: AAA family ATPase [Panacagrimonas sp.]
MPFSITPDPAYLYMSPRHQEALGHLLYGTGQYGGFVQLTGEVGTGKTTVVRTLLEQKLDGVEVAMIHNPRQSEREFVQSVCDELRVNYAGNGSASLKTLVDALNQHLLRNHAEGKRTVLIIDEAQNLAPGVLEQVRLLTNLETHKEKLLRIMLVGQPELSELLSRQDLRQLASRITARYHLTPLEQDETTEYVRHRLGVAGTQETLFPPEAIAEIQRYTRGVPRLINALCDRALLGAYSSHQHVVSADIVRSAASEVLGPDHGGAVDRRSGGFFRVLDRRHRGGLPQITLSWFESVLIALALMIGGALIYQTVLGLQRSEPVVATRTDAAAPVAAVAVSAPAPAPALPASPGAVVQQPATVALKPPAPAASSPDRRAMDRVLSSTPSLAALTNQMIRLWDPGLSISGNVCASLKQQGMECYRTDGDLRDLRSMDRPAILTVRDRRNAERHVLVTQLTEDRARVELAQGSVNVALSDLSSAWTGDMLLLWKRETKLVQLAPGQRGPHILWLRDRLSEMMGKPAGVQGSDRYDDALKEQVRLFQKARGLEADGVVGIRTRIALSDPAPGTPTLKFKP